MGVNDNAGQMRRNGNGSNEDIRPRPDPTAQTAVLVDKAIASLRELIEARIDGNRTLTLERFGDMDKAVLLLQSWRDQQPLETDAKVAHLKELITEQLKGVQTQFLERDTRVRELGTANLTAIAAALQSAQAIVSEQNKSSKESIDKSEKSTGDKITLQGQQLITIKSAIDDKISQQGQQLLTVKEAIDGNISDLKDRLTKIESIAVSQLATRTEGHAAGADTRGQLTMFISAGLAILGVITFILAQMGP